MADGELLQAENVEGGHAEDAHQQPEDDRADDRRHVALDAHVLHRLGQAAALGGDLQADLLAQGGEQPGDEAGDDVADDDHDEHGHDSGARPRSDSTPG